MTELRKGLQPARAPAVLGTLAGRRSAELIKATLVHETSVPASTFTGHLDLLRDVGLVTSIPPWGPNLAKREIGRLQSVVIDTGVALRLARLTAEQLASFEYGESLRGMLESFVAAELLRRRTWSVQEFDAFHYRDRDADEADRSRVRGRIGCGYRGQGIHVSPESAL